MPRLDFIFSSLLDKWLLFDSSSSTLSSADRNCFHEREETGDIAFEQNVLHDAV